MFHVKHILGTVAKHPYVKQYIIKDTWQIELWIVLYPPIHCFIHSYHHVKSTCFTGAFHENICDVRPGRIELPTNPWQGLIIPLNQSRII